MSEVAEHKYRYYAHKLGEVAAGMVEDGLEPPRDSTSYARLCDAQIQQLWEARRVIREYEGEILRLRKENAAQALYIKEGQTEELWNVYRTLENCRHTLQAYEIELEPLRKQNAAQALALKIVMDVVGDSALCLKCGSVNDPDAGGYLSRLFCGECGLELVVTDED
jgi:ribosomal protein S27AE